MKKGAAAGLLVFGSLVAIGGIWVANLCLFFVLLDVGLLPAIFVTAGAVFGITRLLGVFERRYGVSAPKFWLLEFVPSLALSGIFCIILLILDRVEDFKGFLGWIFFAFVYLITSAAAAVIGAIILAISCARKRAKAD